MTCMRVPRCLASDVSRYAGHAIGVKVETGLGFLYKWARLCGSDVAEIEHSSEVGS